ncbi:MAG: metalloregulator ArsR/SmtB family transcription factor [Luminiphilus sp.]|nr:metalloregulator ArsR/SmtB family transcription factor [Luminiphilus sp.]
MVSSVHIIELESHQGPVPLANLLRAAGDALRLQILRVMSQDSYSVTELCSIFNLRQSALSHHLKILIDAGLLCRKKEGTATFYRRALPSGPMAPLYQEIFSYTDAEPLSRQARQGVLAVQAQREHNSFAFFQGNVDRFREQQELIAPWDDYSQITLQLLERISGRPLKRIIEVGVGEGWLLPALHRRAPEVIALDLSLNMLGLARDHAAHLPGIKFVHGDTEDLTREGIRANAVISNMVLHHTPQPERVLADMAQLLPSGGTLIISDLCAHDQAWAREYCGDLWLGFSAEQLELWAKDAGLRLDASVFLAQRNGFQIQVQHFKRC